MNSSLTFTLQIQCICASSLCHRLFCVAVVMTQVSTACSITFFTHVEYTLPLSARGRLRLVRRGGAGRRTCLYHICMVLQQQLATTTSREHVPRIAKLWDSHKLFFFNLYHSHCSIGCAVPWYQAHLKSGLGPLMSLHFVCILRKQPPHDKIALLPTPFCQTPQGTFPDLFNKSKSKPPTIIFPMFICKSTLLCHLRFQCLQLYQKFLD